jgi:hypothetical protein
LAVKSPACLEREAKGLYLPIKQKDQYGPTVEVGIAVVLENCREAAGILLRSALPVLRRVPDLRAHAVAI